MELTVSPGGGDMAWVLCGGEEKVERALGPLGGGGGLVSLPPQRRTNRQDGMMTLSDTLITNHKHKMKDGVCHLFSPNKP